MGADALGRQRTEPQAPGAQSDALIREGLDAYWAGDFVKAIHVLVPQVERILRDLLAI